MQQTTLPNLNHNPYLEESCQAFTNDVTNADVEMNDVIDLDDHDDEESVIAQQLWKVSRCIDDHDWHLPRRLNLMRSLKNNPSHSPRNHTSRGATTVTSTTHSSKANHLTALLSVNLPKTKTPPRDTSDEDDEYDEDDDEDDGDSKDDNDEDENITYYGLQRPEAHDTVDWPVEK